MFSELGVFLVLLFLEVILGVDNIVFIAIVTGKMRNGATVRYIGLGLALLLRLAMLFCVSFVLTLKKPVFYLLSVQDMVFLVGGVFLLFKGIIELAQCVRLKKDIHYKAKSSFLAVCYVAFVDLVFSVDSILTAVAITKNIFLIGLAFTLTIIFMTVTAGSVSKWIERFPELKTLALVFVISIGALLFSEGLHIEFRKSYLYFAFAFSLIVQLCNIAQKCRSTPGRS
ncbi:TerC family protein [Neorickettsia findlayensis]|uniref:DUF475 domain-containing protein n=1 Tax=Neorickettsia findlayensis TaxID=2686014 RepID=A0A6P1GAW9_9RICK|nr:DUF475 domain-containing protein [Neorickettsia findlayensis]QHD65422.1 DUF475 domain-containing protein [Neorickettsia findlayensis]